jgi:hypothetical protein
MRVAKTAAATARSQPTVVWVTEVVKQIARCSVKDLCANRDAHDQVGARAARTIRALAMRTALGNVLRVITQMQERVQRGIGDEHDVAAATAIAARWSTTRHKLLAPESCNAVTAVTALNMNLGAIDKHLKLKATPRRAALRLRRRELARNLC